MRPPAMPLFVQALGLVIATLMAAQIATIVVLFNLPPPPPDIHTVEDVVQAVRSHGPTAPLEGLPLEGRLSKTPPTATTLGHRRLQFRAALASALGVPATDILIAQPGTRIVALGAPPRTPGGPYADRDAPMLFGRFQLGIRQPDGRWLIIHTKSKFGIDPWQERLLLVLAIAATAVSPLAWWFARRIAAPMAALAAGAERLGRDPSAPPLNIQGSAEVAAAVRAFNEMQERLRQYVEYRTGMIGAIAHDLRTPLTRLRFRIEGVPEEIRGKLTADIDQMDAMVSATMAFVRDASSARERVSLEIASLVETVMDDAAETGADCAAEACDRAVVDGDPVALRRMITNLVDNALKFGSRARGRVFVESGMAVVEIDDNGPGIPASQVERAFEPFHRLETSRNRDTGGFGLGLAVVRAIARGHGGDVALMAKAGGGLRARVWLPLGLIASKAAT